MQDRLANYNNRDENSQTVSSRERQLIEQIKKQLQDIHNLSPEGVEHLLLSLPARYQEMVIHTVAEQFIAIMRFHLLHIIATFYQSAQDEEIDISERDGTLQDIEAGIHAIMALDRRLNIETPGNLFKLGKITLNACDLSQCDTAEEAQRWLYNLPAIYQGRLEREHLIKPE